MAQVKKGPLAEAQVVACLQEHGWPHAERGKYSGEHDDPGDIDGILGVAIQVKNSPDYVGQLAGWVNASQRQRIVRGAEVGVVWHKRRGKGDPLDWYVTMTGRDFLALLTEYTREA